ncbi:MAG: ParB/RepB/Spo0J family partition protein [Planctomycetota bacterium]
MSPAGCPKCGFNEFSLVLSEEGSVPVVATKAPPKPAGKVKPAVRPVLKPIEFEYVEREIEVANIRPRPNQPRKFFAVEKLEELGRNIESIGLQQRIIVEETENGHFQLIAGERRWRAFILREWTVIPARIVKATANQKSLICLSENLQREGLSPIEEANSYQDTLTETGWTQTQLAKELGISQGQISNRIRLLKTPAAIQALIISGEIEASVGRDVATWCDVPAVHQELEKWTAETKAGGGEIEKDDVLCATLRFARQCSRPVSTIYAGNGTEKARVLQFETLTPNVEKRLDIRMVPPFIGGEPVMRAFNLQLWDELAVEWTPNVTAANDGPAAEESGDGESAGKTPASQSAEEIERRKVEAKNQYQEALAAYLISWYWRIVALWIPDASSCTRWRLMAYFGHRDFGSILENAALAALIEHCGGIPVANDDGDIDLWASTSLVNDSETFAALLLAKWAEYESRSFSTVDEVKVLMGIVKEFGIRIPDHWTCDRDFLERHDIPGLVNLCLEWKRKGPGPSVTERDDLISWMMTENDHKPFPAPKCLTKLKLFA